MNYAMKSRFLGPLFGILLALPCAAQSAQDQDLRAEVAELRALAQKLQARIDILEKRLPAAPESTAAAAPVPVTPAPVTPAPVPAATPAVGPLAGALAGALAGSTINFTMDGYYGYNFNSPIGRVNLLRAYDVSSNSFSLNQADVVIENAPDPANGKRFGCRLCFKGG
jgi:Putative beta-barrel porin-2, OmpL-like. bbp2